MRGLLIFIIAAIAAPAGAEPTLAELWSKPARSTYFSWKSRDQLETCISLAFENVLVPLHVAHLTYLTQGDMRGFVAAIRISDDGGRRRIEIAKRTSGGAAERAVEGCI